MGTDNGSFCGVCMASVHPLLPRSEHVMFLFSFLNDGSYGQEVNEVYRIHAGSESTGEDLSPQAGWGIAVDDWKGWIFTLGAMRSWVPLQKKEKGIWWLVVDYHVLNEQTEQDSYSLPLIDTISQKQAQKHILTVLDHEHGSHQMAPHVDSRACTAMSTPLGPIQGNVVLIGCKNWEPVILTHDVDLAWTCAGWQRPFLRMTSLSGPALRTFWRIN